MADLAVAFWFSAAVTCHISISELGQRPSSLLHPIWLQGAISLAFLPYKKPFPRMLADEGLLQSVHLFGALVWAPCPKNIRNQSGEQRDDVRREEAAGPAGSAAECGLGHQK